MTAGFGKGNQKRGGLYDSLEVGVREERPQQQQVFCYRTAGDMGCLEEFSQLLLAVEMETKQTEMQKERYSSIPPPQKKGKLKFTVNFISDVIKDKYHPQIHMTIAQKIDCMV